MVTLGVYASIYTSLAYTLANSAFKLIDMLPNWVMTWIGARLESRADDASAIQQMSQGYVQNLAFSNRADQVDLGNRREKQGMKQEIFQQADKASKVNGTSIKEEMGKATESVIAEHGGIDPTK